MGQNSGICCSGCLSFDPDLNKNFIREENDVVWIGWFSSGAQSF
jgi:hypothetical protein